jgi:hypothetical protein
MKPINEPISYGWKWMSLMTITQFLKHESMKLITWRMKCTWMKSPNMHDNIWIKMTIIPIDLLVHLFMWDLCIWYAYLPWHTSFLPYQVKDISPKQMKFFVEWHWDSPNVSWVNVITFTQFLFCEPAWNSHSIVFVEWHTYLTKLGKTKRKQKTKPYTK